MRLEFAIALAIILCCLPLFDLSQLYSVFVAFGSFALFIVFTFFALYLWESMPSKDPTLREHAEGESGTSGFLMVIGALVFGGLLIAHGLGMTSSDGPAVFSNGVPVQPRSESGLSRSFSIVGAFIFFFAAWWIGGMRSSHKATIAQKKQAKADRKAAGYKR